MIHRNNFDFLRFIFSLFVVIGHSILLSGYQGFHNPFFEVMPTYSVFAFFVISGFLVYSSLYRLQDLKKYLLNRARRILPPYIFVVLFFSFFLFFLSDASIKDYFSMEWLKYVFYNLIFLNFLKPCIPYVFTNNPECFVNGSLWTIKIEVMFYLFLPFLFYVIKGRSRFLKNSILVILYILSISYFHYFHGNYRMAKQFPGCLTYFVSGICMFVNLEYFKKNFRWWIIPSILVILLEKFYFKTTLLFPFALAIVIVFVAYSKLPLQQFGKYGDISYGMYLVHFPIIQSLVALGIFEKYAFGGLLLCYLLIFAASALIWKYIEKPFIRKKSY